ncbi:MAG: signal peptidase I [Candidatus Moranbacteria bacterium RIFCSPHIGHO2_12_FULL_54_9]|nr:MAG: signal peptidase I [Candidatus Moranbacteria bacterium RIFCSPHIGHO2_01_FULL_54_31]OGI24594.1 MAG: signal peptidase I [Candidatus Moranbacteria bacterium RIFCSPHIGHO2_12_FULL_54_9]
MTEHLKHTPDASQEAEVEYLGIGGLLLEMAKVFLLAVVVIIPVRVFLFQPFFVQGSSMEPNFEDGQYLVISEFGYKETKLALTDTLQFTANTFKTIERQDVVVFRYPKNPEQFFIKRVIGLPGEAVEIRHGKVIIYNTIHPEGFVLDESSYLSTRILTQDMPRTIVGEDGYFMMGDNRMFSYDSRSIGPIKKDRIIGRVLMRAWPVERFSVY